MRIVLDTNILICALITKGTPPDGLYQAWLRGEIDLVTSAVQIAELANVLARPRLQKYIDADEAAAIVENIEARAIILDAPPDVDLSPDPKDNPILAAAIAGKADMIDLAMKNALAAPSDSSISSLWNFGGATADVAAESTAFGDRSMGWMYSLDGVWSDAKDDAADMAWSREGWESAEPYGQHGRAYLNFPSHGEDGDALTRASFGANYQRLVEIKTKYDPQNRFRFNRNIQPET